MEYRAGSWQVLSGDFCERQRVKQSLFRHFVFFILIELGTVDEIEHIWFCKNKTDDTTVQDFVFWNSNSILCPNNVGLKTQIQDPDVIKCYFGTKWQRLRLNLKQVTHVPFMHCPTKNSHFSLCVTKWNKYEQRTVIIHTYIHIK